jgi:hypothetical protein
MKKQLLLGLIMMTLLMSAKTTEGQLSMESAQSIFIFNFTRQIDWPENYKSGEFVIGILGSCPLYDALNNYVANKKVGGQPISVKKFATVADVSKCHILFVPYGKTKSLAEVTTKLSGQSTLIITERAGATDQGAGINFIMKDDKLKFELKTSNVVKYGLKVQAALETLAIVK